MEQHTACEVATMRVMLMRATAALSTHKIVDATIETGDGHGRSMTKPSAYLQAFMRVASEHRRCMQLYGLGAATAPVPDAVVREQERRAAVDTSLLPEDLAELEPPEPPTRQQAKALLNEAESFAYEHNSARAHEAFRRAEFLSPVVAAQARERGSALYSPALARMFPAPKGGGERVDDS
jgi:hypothetical protein